MQTSDHDIIQPFSAKLLNLHGCIVHIDDVASSILGRQDYPDLVAHMLTEVIAVTVTLGSSALNKQKGSLSFQISGNGPIKTCISDFYSNNACRGHSQFNASDINFLARKLTDTTPLTMEEVFGKGYVLLTLNYSKSSNHYQSIIKLTGQTITDCLTEYLCKSQQILSYITSAIYPPTAEHGWRASVLLIQRFGTKDPDITNHEEAWSTAVDLMKKVTPQTLNFQRPPSQLIHDLFHEYEYSLHQPSVPEFSCNCTREKIMKTLVQFSPSDIKEMATDGRIVVTCQFCNASYMFTSEQIKYRVKEYKGMSDDGDLDLQHPANDPT